MFVFFSQLLGRAYEWAAHLVIISVFLALWKLFVEPYQSGLLTWMQWYANQTLYKVFDQETALFVADTLVVFITISMLLVILGMERIYKHRGTSEHVR